MVRCIKNITDEDIYLSIKSVDLSRYITIGRNYCTQPNPCSDYVYNIIDDRGKMHDIGKDMFIEISLLRQEKLDLLGL